MAAVLSLKEAQLDTAETLTDEIRDPAVLSAARHLISRHRAGQAFDIHAFDVPHRALADIAEKLEAAGMSHALSTPLMEALRRYVLASGGSFTRAVNAKPVVIHLAVADQMPDRRFESGMTELACIGTTETRVEGAASINVRATPSGTATTSNAANVDAMFANVRGLNLWVRFEAPTRDEMDALLTSMEASLAGLVQSIGGAISAGDLKNLLAKLEQDGTLTPAVLELVNKIIFLQEGLTAGTLSGDKLHALLGDITTLIKSGQSENLIPPALIQAALSTLREFSSNDAVMALLANNGVQGIIADNDNLPGDLTMGKELLTLLEGIAAQIEAGDITAENVPPELATLIEQMGGIETLLQAEGREGRMELLSQALMDDGSSPLAEAVQTAVIAMASADHSLGLPAETIQLMQAFVKNNPEIVDIAATNSLVRTMTEQLSTMDPASPEATELGKAIELLKQEGTLALMDKSVQAALPPEAQQIVQNFAQSNPAVVEILVTHSIMNDMKAMMASMDPNTPEAMELNKAIELLQQEGFTVLLDKNIQAALPAEAVSVIQNFADNHPAAIEIAATNAFLTDMKHAAINIDPTAPQAIEIAAIIEQIEAQGISKFLESKADLSPEIALVVASTLNSHGIEEGSITPSNIVLETSETKVSSPIHQEKTVTLTQLSVVPESISSTSTSQENTVAQESAHTKESNKIIPNDSSSAEKSSTIETTQSTPSQDNSEQNDAEKITPTQAVIDAHTNSDPHKQIGSAQEGVKPSQDNTPTSNDPCASACMCLEDFVKNPTPEKWEQTKSKLELIAQQPAVNSSGVAVPVIQAVGDADNPTIIITHPESGVSGNAKITTMPLAEFIQDGINNLKARQEIQTYTRAPVSTDALRAALAAQTKGSALHVHFGNCCGGAGGQGNATTLEQDNAAIATNTTIIIGDSNAAELNLNEATADSRTKAMSDAFGFNDFKP